MSKEQGLPAGGDVAPGAAARKRPDHRRVRGKLGHQRGCLGANGSVIVWPSGTKVVSHDPLTIDVPGHGKFAVGDAVQIGGGYVLEHSSSDVEPGPVEVAGVTVPAECAKHDIFLAH